MLEDAKSMDRNHSTTMENYLGFFINFCFPDGQMRPELGYVLIFLGFLLIVAVIFIMVTTISNHILMNRVIESNKSLGIGMNFGFGWKGVQLTSCPGAGPNPSSTNKKVEKE